MKRRRLAVNESFRSFNPHPTMKLDEMDQSVSTGRNTGFNPHPAVRLDERLGGLV